MRTGDKESAVEEHDEEVPCFDWQDRSFCAQITVGKAITIPPGKEMIEEGCIKDTMLKKQPGMRVPLANEDWCDEECW
jgi:hypothetical protein